MIYAIPHSRDCVANHFMKAKQFAFFDDSNTLIQDVISPAAGNSGCRDKSAAINLIKEMNTEAVIIRNIGQRALGKLLNAGIRVFQVTGGTPFDQAVTSPMMELTDASQGRPSRNHEKKGGKCCGSSPGHAHQHDERIGQSRFHGQGEPGRLRSIRQNAGNGAQMRHGRGKGQHTMTGLLNAISSVRPVKQ